LYEEVLHVKTLVTGATGFIGRHLIRRLEDVVAFSRHAEAAQQKLPGAAVFSWDPVADQPPPEAFAGVDTVIHLAGESIAEGRWTDAKRARIHDSRVLGTRNLVAALCQLENKPKLLVSASAAGYYGDRGEQILDEAAPPGDDFLSRTSVDWERETEPAVRAGIRVVTPRTGIVLGPDGGAVPKLAKLFRFGLGSPLGSGRQWMPWIHIDDLVGLFLYVAGHPELQGPVNAVAPNPVTNRQFTKALGRAVHRPTFLPAVPAPVLRAALGGFADALLASQRVVPRAALAAGYAFQYPELEPALRDCV
jgi:uncharacterized protein (TIGR01777 family)